MSQLHEVMDRLIDDQLVAAFERRWYYYGRGRTHDAIVAYVHGVNTYDAIHDTDKAHERAAFVRDRIKECLGDRDTVVVLPADHLRGAA